MLRIAKSTPGVLDLSAVKDEHGLPVTLIGPSHRDVPNHEESNPVLQRIVELGWVTIGPVPLEVAETAEDGAPVSIDDGQPPATEPPPPSDVSIPEDPQTSTEPPADLAPSDAPTSDDAINVQGPPTPEAGVEPAQDEPAKLEGSKPSGKSDARKAGRRS